MSYKIANKDYTTLPGLMLEQAKEHMRVDFTDDDNLIKSILGRAIDLYERKTGLTIFDGDFEWKPDGFDNVTDDGIQCPAQPLGNPMTMVDSGAADVSSSWSLVGNVIPGQASGVYLRPVTEGTTLPDGMTVTAKLGYEDVATMPPATLDSILRIAAHLYANREAISDLLLREADWWADDLLVGAWVPRV